MRLELHDVLLNRLAAVRPIGRALRRARILLRPADRERIVESSFKRFAMRRRLLGDERIRGASLVEIGSGSDFCLALLLLALGACRVINVEIYPDGFRREASLYRLLVERATARGLPMAWPPPGLLVEPRGQVVLPDSARIALHLGVSAASIPEADQSADVTFSVAVLEHVRREDMPAVARELYRVTRAGGTGYHRVDLVDHYHRRDDPFRFLRLSAREHESMCGNRRSYSNRYRVDDLERIFRQAGFCHLGFENVERHPDQEEFSRWHGTFHPEFRERDIEMLRVRTCVLVLAR